MKNSLTPQLLKDILNAENIDDWTRQTNNVIRALGKKRTLTNPSGDSTKPSSLCQDVINCMSEFHLPKLTVEDIVNVRFYFENDFPGAEIYIDKYMKHHQIDCKKMKYNDKLNFFKTHSGVAPAKQKAIGQEESKEQPKISAKDQPKMSAKENHANGSQNQGSGKKSCDLE